MKKDSKKQVIMEIATELFLKNGFERTSVEAITKKVGIAKGSFYTYFDSKEELLREIIAFTMSAIENELSMKVKKSSNPIGAIEEFLKINGELSKKYIPGILIALREVEFASVSSKQGIGAEIVNRVKKLLKDFVESLKGKCSEEDLVFIWGITLSFWIESGFEGSVPDFKKLAGKIWNGLGGDGK